MQDFLDAIFGNAVSADQRISLFTLPERRSHFCATSTAAASLAKESSQSQDVYFGVGLIQGKPKGRGKAKDVCAIGALWADVDFASEAHPNKSLPADEEDFAKLLAELPLAPSIIVDSGHGRHLYWLLQAPWLLGDKAERQQANRVAHGWHEVVCNSAEQFGWSLENLGELARVLRLPGTVNRKLPDDPRPVHILEADYSRRFAIADFEEYLPEIDIEPISTPPVVESPKVEPAPEPPTDKLQAALQESSQFWQTWHRCRSDLLDQSASAYDLSLATLAVLRGWSDSEIAALIIAWRRLHDERPEKANRPDYLSRTIARARAAESNDEAPVDLSNFNCSCSQEVVDEPPSLEYPDPGPIPESMCRIPGFVSEVMDHCLATAPHPNVPLAFCGALALQAVLAGRKVRDEADNRTNIYLLGLAFSSVGKDWPRKINTSILHHVGLTNCLGDKFASGEGIQDALFQDPALLFQTDEIDGLLQAINKSRDARFENILGTLLTMYSSANSIYPMRRKAGKENPGAIDQPCLVVYGAAIPTHYYAALSERMLTNGFFARMLIVESSPRANGQDGCLLDPPASILETAQWWADFQPGRGNLENWHPQPKVVPATGPARKLLRETRSEADSEYSKAESRGDPVGTTVWGRVHEQTRKLALLHAVSANHTDPMIDVEAVRWASEFIVHQTRRMLFMAHGHVAENPFHGDCLKVLNKLYEAEEKSMSHSGLLKRMKMDAKSFRVLIETLIEQGDVAVITKKTAGRTGVHYRLVSRSLSLGEAS